MLKKIVVNYHTNVKPDRDTIVIDNTPPNLNRGFAKAVNIGIKQALKQKATRILLINPDVKISQKQINDLLKFPGDIVGPVLKFKRKNQWIYDFGGKVNLLFGRTSHVESSHSSLVTGHSIDYVSGACMLIKREVIEKIGFLDERFFMYFEDADFCLRAKQAGFNIAVDPAVVIDHGLAKTKQKYHYVLQSNWKFINKWLPFPIRILGWLYFFALYARTNS